jgi:hypothetical protein
MQVREWVKLVKFGLEKELVDVWKGMVVIIIKE